MTLAVLAVALMHTIPVFLIGALSKSKKFLTIAAIFFAILGVVIGNPAYVVVDLIAVGIAYFLGISFINGNPAAATARADPPPSQPAPPVENGGGLHFLHVVGLCSLGGWVLTFYMDRQGGQSIMFLVGMAAAPALAL